MPAYSPQHAAIVEPLRAAGATTQAMLRALKAAGCPLNYRTLRKHLDAAQRPAAGLAATLQASRDRRAAEQAEQAALAPDDDLGRLARRRDQVDAAMTAWEGELQTNGAAVRAYRTLSAELTSLTRALVELRPRPEVEADRLEALGTAARVELLERAKGAASADEISAIKLKLADAERANAILRKALAE